MIKAIFLILLGAVIGSILFAYKKISGTHNKITFNVKKILLAALFTIIAHIGAILASSTEVALASFALYFISVSWMAVFILEFCKSYTGSKYCSRVFFNVLYAVTTIVSLCFIANVFKPFIFGVYTIPFASSLYYVIRLAPLFYIHFGIGLLLYLYSVFIILERISHSPSFFKIRYYSIANLLVLLFLSTVLYGFLHIPFNFTIVLYALFVAFFHYELTVLIPRRIVNITLNRIVDGLKNGIILCDDDGKCIYINDFVMNIFECTTETVLRTPIINSYLELKKTIAVNSNDSFIQEFDYVKDDIHYALKVSDYVISEAGILVGRYILIEDITSEKKQIYEQKILRTRDTLTRVYNKEFFFEKVEHRIKFDRFTPYYLIVTDIVNFKLINDLYGKSVGDDILLKLADSFRINCTPDEIYGRLYNDHFVLFIPRRNFHAEAYIEAFRQHMSFMNTQSFTIIGHMGVYALDDLSTPVSVMCDRALIALRTIKDDYRTCCAFYDDNLRTEMLKMQMLMNELPKALKNGELAIYLQPQFTKDLKVVGAEALVRWQHPERGVIPPAEFIEIIEKINIISDVDKYVWECACAKLAEWKKNGRDDLYISVNISPKDFYTLDLYEVFTGLVKKYDISPSRLNLEITETAVIMDVNNQVKLLDKLRAFGFQIEMDDFGSGYSSLNMLKDISVDVLKIDMGFLQKSQNDEKSRIILEKIIVLAKELGMSVVTEGVESVHQIDFLSEFGCDLFQGYYFSRPIPVSDFEERYF